jgi:hypothetical protein
MRGNSVEWQHNSPYLSVIVGAPYIPAVTRFEVKDKPVLLIHSNAVKTIQIPP